MSGLDSFTKFLGHFDSSFVDDSGNGRTVTAHNTPTIASDQSKFGGFSGKFVQASSQYLTLDGDSSLAFGTGDFVVDHWIRFNGSVGTVFFWDFNKSGGGDVAPYLLTVGGVLTFGEGVGGNHISGSTLVTGTWYHVAVVRSSGTTRMFLNGVQDGSNYTDSNNYVVGANAPGIAAASNGNVPIDGWIDEFRISKGTDRGWSGGFTVPGGAYSPMAVHVHHRKMQGLQ